MKRVYIAAVVLIICFSLSIFSYFTITRESVSLIKQSEKIEKLLIQKDYEKIETESTLIKNEWKKFSLAFSLLTTHIHYDALEECIDKLYNASQTKNEGEIKKACDDLIFEANHIITSITPRAENVF